LLYLLFPHLDGCFFFNNKVSSTIIMIDTTPSLSPLSVCVVWGYRHC
jgi:hypothetical protein